MNFNELNLRELDKDLSEEEQKEWNAIYASYRAGSALTGCVAGVDEFGEGENTVRCLVVIAYRVKVLIPETEIWFDEKTARPPHVLLSMSGAEVDYVITGIDRENWVATASRRQALSIRRARFRRAKRQPGTVVPCRVLAVGRVRLLAEAGGCDFTLSQRGLSYGMIPDLREDYRPGQECRAVIREIDDKGNLLDISVREAEPPPFDGADQRHPIGSRRASKITGKYGGGVFCRLERSLDCLCKYSPYQQDSDFAVGDKVIVVVTKYNYERKLVYGKIVAKW